MEQTTVMATTWFKQGDRVIARNLATVIDLLPGKIYEVEKTELNKYDNRYLFLEKIKKEEERFKELGYRVIHGKQEIKLYHVMHYVSQLLFLKEDSEERGVDASYFKKVGDE